MGITILVLFLAFFLILLSGIGALFSFGEIVQWEHDSHLEQWREDGMPFSFFHRPDTGDLVIFWWQTDPLKTCQSLAISMRWLFRAPHWIQEDEEASRWLWRFRTGVLVWSVGSTAYFIGWGRGFTN